MNDDELDEPLPTKKPAPRKKKNRYTQILEELFEERFDPDRPEIPFNRDDVDRICEQLKVPRIKNIGDLPYTFRYRADFPESLANKAPRGMIWVIWPAGKGKYQIAPAKSAEFVPRTDLTITKVPDSTPGIIEMHAMDDEQAVLARVRYNRLIDVFSGVTTYSLQSHWRTAVKDIGQLETDEIYVGLDRKGAQYVFPVQAKGKSDRLHIVQVYQDWHACRAQFAGLICRPIGAQFLDDETICLFEFEGHDREFAVANEKHYRLVPPDDVTQADLDAYKARTD